MPALPGGQPLHELLEPAQGTRRLGQLGIARPAGLDRGVVRAGQRGEQCPNVVEIGHGIRHWQHGLRSLWSARRQRGAEKLLLRDLKVALLFLTRFPVQVDGTATMRDLAGAVYAFPVVGAVIGLLGGLAYWGAMRIGLPALPAALIAITAMIAILPPRER